MDMGEPNAFLALMTESTMAYEPRKLLLLPSNQYSNTNDDSDPVEISQLIHKFNSSISSGSSSSISPKYMDLPYLVQSETSTEIFSSELPLKFSYRFNNSSLDVGTSESSLSTVSSSQFIPKPRLKLIDCLDPLYESHSKSTEKQSVHRLFSAMSTKNAEDEPVDEVLAVFEAINSESNDEGTLQSMDHIQPKKRSKKKKKFGFNRNSTPRGYKKKAKHKKNKTITNENRFKYHYNYGKYTKPKYIEHIPSKSMSTMSLSMQSISEY